MEEQKTPDLDLKGLGSFIGTENYYKVWGLNVTDGVKYLMDNGYSWFVTDAAIAIRMRRDLREQLFLVVKLSVNREAHTALTTMTDGNSEDSLYSQCYEWTDARRDLKLYYENEVLCLTSER